MIVMKTKVNKYCTASNHIPNKRIVQRDHKKHVSGI